MHCFGKYSSQCFLNLNVLLFFLNLDSCKYILQYSNGKGSSSGEIDSLFVICGKILPQKIWSNNAIPFYCHQLLNQIIKLHNLNQDSEENLHTVFHITFDFVEDLCLEVLYKSAVSILPPILTQLNIIVIYLLYYFHHRNFFACCQ
jgi:hypothetical protein